MMMDDRCGIRKCDANVPNDNDDDKNNNKAMKDWATQQPTTTTTSKMTANTRIRTTTATTTARAATWTWYYLGYSSDLVWCLSDCSTTLIMVQTPEPSTRTRPMRIAAWTPLLPPQQQPPLSRPMQDHGVSSSSSFLSSSWLFSFLLSLSSSSSTSGQLMTITKTGIPGTRTRPRKRTRRFAARRLPLLLLLPFYLVWLLLSAFVPVAVSAFLDSPGPSSSSHTRRQQYYYSNRQTSLLSVSVSSCGGGPFPFPGSWAQSISQPKAVSASSADAAASCFWTQQRQPHERQRQRSGRLFSTTTTAAASSSPGLARFRSQLWRQSGSQACDLSSSSTSSPRSFRSLRLTSMTPQTGRRATTCTSSTALCMVLNTPEAIIEQASTQKLLDDLIDESTRMSSRRPIMRQFDPSSGWIWKRWKGTIFSETWDSCVSKMAYAMILIFLVTAQKHALQKLITNHLQGFNVLWGQMLQVTTFTLTFFLNQSYALWRQCYALSRRLQGRLHDINMSLAAHAVRKPLAGPPTSSSQDLSSSSTSDPYNSSGGSSSSTNGFSADSVTATSGGTISGGSVSTSGGSPSNGGTASAAATTLPNYPSGSKCTDASRRMLELISRYCRLFNLLTYASFTRSHRPILTPAGMRRLVDRGLLTPQEREVLIRTELPATQRHNAVLMWIFRAFIEGMQAGLFVGGAGFENQIIEKLHVCRAQYGAIGDELSARMPLAYAHIVQVLVDVVLWMYPVMAISSNMSPVLAVLGTGILTITYQGLFDLAKQFLDPYDNESFGKGEDPLVVDTLIAETNAGSIRWMNSLKEFPISSQRIQAGDLSEYLLPIRGFSVAELEQRELERIERERERQERLQREEEERRMAEEKARQMRQAAQAMIPALYNASDYNLSVLDDKYLVQMDSRLPRWNDDLPAYVTPSSNLQPTTTNGDTSARPRERLKDLENRLPKIGDNSKNKDFPLAAGQGISHIVTHLDDIAGGVPLGLIPPKTAPAKQERKLSTAAAMPKVADTTKSSSVDEAGDSSKGNGDSQKKQWPSEPTNGDWVKLNGDVAPLTGISSGTLTQNDRAKREQEENIGTNATEAQTQEDDVVEKNRDKGLPWLDEQVDVGRKNSPSEDSKAELHENQLHMSSINATESGMHMLEAKNDTESNESPVAPSSVVDLMDGSGKVSNIWKSNPESEEDSDDPWRDLFVGASDYPASWWNINERIGTDYDGMGMLWGSEPDSWSMDDASIDDAVSPLAPEAYGMSPVADSPATEGDITKSGSDLSENEKAWEQHMQLQSEQSEAALPDLVSSEDYEKQLADLLAAEHREMVETQAIMNAPAFAESLAGYDMDGSLNKPKVALARNETVTTKKKSQSKKAPKPEMNVAVANDPILLFNATDTGTKPTPGVVNNTQPAAISKPENSTIALVVNSTVLSEGPRNETASWWTQPLSQDDLLLPPTNGTTGDTLMIGSEAQSRASEEYEKQLAEQRQAEKEMVETAAILNAPSFAISLTGYGVDDPVRKYTVNETAAKLIDDADDLSILEMDVVVADKPRKDDGLSRTNATNVPTTAAVTAAAAAAVKGAAMSSQVITVANLESEDNSTTLSSLNSQTEDVSPSNQTPLTPSDDSDSSLDKDNAGPPLPKT